MIRKGLLSFALIPVLLASVAAQTSEPRIVNGDVTASYPQVGVLLLFRDSTWSTISGFCSGTLIGCRSFLTAAHCVCPEETFDARSCQRRGLTDVGRMAVFFPNVGLVAVAATSIHPEYSFAESSDLGLVTLAADASGIAPAAINFDGSPAAGTPAHIVGFGVTRGDLADGGLKRVGKATVAACAADLPEEQLVCWNFNGSESNICGGDSGGPLFLASGASEVLAGVSSGGSDDFCMAPDSPFDTDVFVNRSWVQKAVGADLGSSCGAGVVEPLLEATGTLEQGDREISLSLDVPADTAELRVGLNGTFWNDSGFASIPVDFDLQVSGPDGVVCRDQTATVLGFCSIPSPAAGPWSVTVTRVQGQGGYQLTASGLVDATAACAGDCDEDGNVTVDEVVEGINIALGVDGVVQCRRLDGNGDGNITVDEILTAIGHALTGCS